MTIPPYESDENQDALCAFLMQEYQKRLSPGKNKMLFAPHLAFATNRCRVETGNGILLDGM
jgi:hypothetical protein